MRFDDEYRTQVASEVGFLGGRELMPPSFQAQARNRRTRELMNDFFWDLGNIQRPKVLVEVRSEAEWLDSILDWGSETKDSNSFNGFNAFVVESRAAVVTKTLWPVLSKSPLYPALAAVMISTPSSLDRTITKACRKQSIDEFRRKSWAIR